MARSVPVMSQGPDFEAVVRQMLLAEPAPAQIPHSCFRPVMSRRNETPSNIVQVLYEKVKTTIVVPALRCATRTQYMQLVAAHWREFMETTEALRVVLESSAPSLLASTTVDADRELMEAARKLAGDVAAEETEFDLATCERAFAVAEKLPRTLAADEDGRRVLREFHTHIFLHVFGELAIRVASEDGARATQAGICTSFELFRGGALHAYSVARGALMEREKKEDVPESFEELPFDEEDMRLAAAG